jgi:hypothetical protein
MNTGAPDSGTALVAEALKGSFGGGVGYRSRAYRAIRLRNVAGDSPAFLLKNLEK